MAELDKLVSKYKLQSILTEDGHWLFKGTRGSSGHANITYKNKPYLLHRLIFCLVNNLDYKDASFYACHKLECNIPYCWNPDHIYKGTPSTNNFDIVKSKNHHEANKTHCPRGHAYSEYGRRCRNGKRKCMECHRLRDKNRIRRTRKDGTRYTVPGTRIF